MPSKRTPEQNEARNARKRKRYQENLSADRDGTLRREAKRKREARSAGQFTIREDGYLYCGRMEYACVNCGALHWLAERVLASGSTMSSPKFHKCCSSGQLVSNMLLPSVCPHCCVPFRDSLGHVRAPNAHEACPSCHKIVPEPLPTFQSPPDLLRVLLTSQDSRSKHFRKNIRQYNNALAMGSVTANFVARGPGPSAYNPTLTIQGRMYHHIGAINPLPGQTPQFASLYFHDTEYATQKRKEFQNTLHEYLLKSLAHMLEKENNLVKSFVSLRDLMHDGKVPREMELVLHAHERTTSGHVRKYNIPDSSEVAALIVGEQHGPLDIVLKRKATHNANGDEHLDVISVGNRLRDPLCYPLLFFDGCGGWHSKLTFQNNKGKTAKVTPMLFYSRLFYARKDDFNLILRCGRLFQQFLCEAAYTMEAERLSFLRYNQSKIRATNHTRLLELLGDAAMPRNEVKAWTEGVSDEQTGNIGRLVVLPATYLGGDRYMRMKMHDIIAISNTIGHPDVFLTMTCNPNWPEITGALFAGQRPDDRPDLCNRVFKVKQRILLDYLKREEPFGRMRAHVSVIEFQKRGLPHAHIILFLDERAKNNLQNPDHVDKLISAEIPPISDPHLRSAVLKHMIHKPCTHISSAPCLRDGRCSRGFPKSFAKKQVFSKGLITYRTEDVGSNLVVKQFKCHTWSEESVIKIAASITHG